MPVMPWTAFGHVIHSVTKRVPRGCSTIHCFRETFLKALAHLVYFILGNTHFLRCRLSSVKRC